VVVFLNDFSIHQILNVCYQYCIFYRAVFSSACIVVIGAVYIHCSGGTFRNSFHLVMVVSVHFQTSDKHTFHSVVSFYRAYA